MIELKGFNFKTSINEMTIAEWQLISNIVYSEDDFVEKYIKIFQALGASDDIIDEMEESDLIAFVDEFSKNTQLSTVKKRGFELDGRTYVAYEGDEYVLKLKDLSYIEKSCKKEKNFFSLMLAIVFKDTDVINHYSEWEINRKAELFQHLNAGEYLNYITFITEKLAKKLENMNG